MDDQDGCTFACIGVAVLIAVALVTVPSMIEGHDVRYEVEMDDGTVYMCHSYSPKKNGETVLYDIDGAPGHIRVLTHQIVSVKEV